MPANLTLVPPLPKAEERPNTYYATVVQNRFPEGRDDLIAALARAFELLDESIEIAENLEPEDADAYIEQAEAFIGDLSR